MVKVSRTHHITKDGVVKKNPMGKSKEYNSTQEVVLGRFDRLIVYFEGHEFEITHDSRTNENLMIRKVL